MRPPRYMLPRRSQLPRQENAQRRRERECRKIDARGMCINIESVDNGRNNAVEQNAPHILINVMRTPARRHVTHAQTAVYTRNTMTDDDLLGESAPLCSRKQLAFRACPEGTSPRRRTFCAPTRRIVHPSPCAFTPPSRRSCHRRRRVPLFITCRLSTRHAAT